MPTPKGRAADGGAARVLPAVPDQMTAALLRAARAEFIEHGFAQARVSEVARRAGMSTGAVYARWPRKPDLFVAVLDDTFRQILPQRTLERTDAADAGPREQVSILAAQLMDCGGLRDVLIHAFSSAHNNDGIRESLSRFLNEEADELRAIVDQGKRMGLVDSSVATAATALLGQAIAIGVHFLLSAGLEDRNVPTHQEWDALMARVIRSTAPIAPQPPASADPMGRTGAPNHTAAT